MCWQFKCERALIWIQRSICTPHASIRTWLSSDWPTKVSKCLCESILGINVSTAFRNACISLLIYTTAQIQHDMVIDLDQPLNNARAKLIAVVLHFIQNTTYSLCAAFECSISNCKWWAKEEIAQNWYDVRKSQNKLQNSNLPVLTHSQFIWTFHRPLHCITYIFFLSP